MAFASVPSINTSPSGYAAINFSVVQLTPVYIKNNLSTATPDNFSEQIILNSSLYYGYENANLSNVFFTNFSGGIIPSWLQSGNNSADNNTSYWLRINSSIPAYSTLVIYLDAAIPVSTNLFNNYSIGEAPQLSKVYGQYDDGSHVFNLYDNFAGTSLNNSKWKANGAAYISVDNGITFLSPDTYITSNSTYAAPAYAEVYGIMNTPETADDTAYNLGGVGFGNGGLNIISWFVN